MTRRHALDPIGNILVLDYYKSTAEAMRGVLEDLYPECQVDSFTALENAFEGGIRKKRYDLIISNCEHTVKNGVDSPSAKDISEQLYKWVRENNISHNQDTPILFYGDGPDGVLAKKYQNDSRVMWIGQPGSEAVQGAVHMLYEHIRSENYAKKMEGLMHPDLIAGVVNPRHVTRVERYRETGQDRGDDFGPGKR